MAAIIPKRGFFSSLIMLFIVLSILSNSYVLTATSTSPTPTSTGQILTVTKLDDTDDGVCDSDCSLREAVQVSTWGANIVFATNLQGTLVLKDTLLLINRNLSIKGPGPKSSKIIINGQNILRGPVIHVGQKTGDLTGPAYLQLDLLTISNGPYGGIFVSNGTLRVDHSTFENNRRFGAIAVQEADAQVNRSSFAHNTGSLGGAIDVYSLSTLIVSSSTFYENHASIGGTIHSYGKTKIYNSTFFSTDPYAATIGTFIGNESTNPIEIANSILSGRRNLCSGSIMSLGGNIQYPDDSCGSKMQVADPGLGPYQDNGGATFTMSLAANSPAFNIGISQFCNSLTNTDQRDLTRSPENCDSGAVELP